MPVSSIKIDESQLDKIQVLFSKLNLFPINWFYDEKDKTGSFILSISKILLTAIFKKLTTKNKNIMID